MLEQEVGLAVLPACRLPATAPTGSKLMNAVMPWLTHSVLAVSMYCCSTASLRPTPASSLPAAAVSHSAPLPLPSHHCSLPSAQLPVLQTAGCCRHTAAACPDNVRLWLSELHVGVGSCCRAQAWLAGSRCSVIRRLSPWHMVQQQWPEQCHCPSLLQCLYVLWTLGHLCHSCNEGYALFLIALKSL